MNLIERLGGYEAAKAEGEEWGFDDFLNNQLLEYRRQHNIFEVGDRVVFTDKYSNNILLTITELTCSYAFTSMEFGEISFDSVRHADDAEIKVGKRLEVNQ